MSSSSSIGLGVRGAAMVHKVIRRSTGWIHCARQFRDISTRLTSLHIKEEAIFSELCCLDSISGQMDDIHWPHLERLHLECAWKFLPFGSMQRYANYDYGTLEKHYIEDLSESLGYAIQGMPRPRSAIFESHFLPEVPAAWP